MERLEGTSVNIIQGILAGVLAEATGKRMRAEEVMCVGKGDPYCEIVVKLLR